MRETFDRLEKEAQDLGLGTIRLKPSRLSGRFEIHFGSGKRFIGRDLSDLFHTVITYLDGYTDAVNQYTKANRSHD